MRSPLPRDGHRAPAAAPAPGEATVSPQAPGEVTAGDGGGGRCESNERGGSGPTSFCAGTGGVCLSSVKLPGVSAGRRPRRPPSTPHPPASLPPVDSVVINKEVLPLRSRHPWLCPPAPGAISGCLSGWPASAETGGGSAPQLLAGRSRQPGGGDGQRRLCFPRA